MSRLLRELSALVTYFHIFFVKVFDSLGFNFTDKQLHFIVIGLMGIIVFVLSTILFKWLARYSIQFVAFFFTSTVLLVIVFAIEVQQKVTGSGKMEFADVVYGLWGYLSIMVIYVINYIIFRVIKNTLNKIDNKSEPTFK